MEMNKTQNTQDLKDAISIMLEKADYKTLHFVWYLLAKSFNR